ncbi:hypothetical protein EOM60_01300 [Candidatus Saccharibacteria bacterium]|nr:hypothetical protein [Candidatus Saccharibacteria bacterium]
MKTGERSKKSTLEERLRTAVAYGLIGAAGLTGYACSPDTVGAKPDVSVTTVYVDPSQSDSSESSAEFPEDIANMPLDTGINAENMAKYPRDPVWEKNLREALFRLQQDGWDIEGPLPGSFEGYIVSKGGESEKAYVQVIGANPFDQEVVSDLPGTNPVKIIVYPAGETLPVYDLSALSKNYYYVP